jgi:DNA-binding IclR family transcriptional regulator
MGSTVGTVGVIDKAVAILAALESQPLGLADLVGVTGLSRATTHRLATALEAHGLTRRDHEGRFALGARTIALGRAAETTWPLAARARPALAHLRDATGESVQLFVRHGDVRVCVASLESPHGLRTIVETGAELPIEQGSGGKALRGDVGSGGWAESVAEREAGVASVSAPVTDRRGAVLAAVSVSGPIERLGRTPGRRYGTAVVAAARAIGEAVT